MITVMKDVVIIGGGPAGLAAANALYKKGVKDIIVLERENGLGGILRQCIHDGFGLTRFKESLTGPEYAQRFVEEAESLQVPILTSAMVIGLNKDKEITVATKKGLIKYQAKAIVLAMGCRERTRGAISIPGERPAGVFTAGVAQAYINLYNRMVGKKVVILGSGDIGLIMARRLTLEGAQVLGVYEIQAYASGLSRNIEQCLNDYDIPLYLSHTVSEIHGNSRMTGVTVSQVDESYEPLAGTEKFIEADALVLSVGLIPENELSIEATVALDKRTNGAVVDEGYQTSVEGIFAIGNALHVHDLVDFVSLEGERAAQSIRAYLIDKANTNEEIEIIADSEIVYTVPQVVKSLDNFVLSFRVKKPLKNGCIQLMQDGKIITKKSFKKALPAEMMMIEVAGHSLTWKKPLEVRIQCQEH